MRDSEKDLGRLQHMHEMATLLNIEKDKHSIDEIIQDKILFYGLSKMVEILGEAAYMITKDFKTEHPQLPWRQIEGMRHILVHGYYSISPELLWDVIQNDIPTLVSTLKIYINEINE